MRKKLPTVYRYFLLLFFGLTCSYSRASHIAGAQLTYQWLTCNTYQITLLFYGNCGTTSSAAFSTLPTTNAELCIYDGNTYVASITLDHITNDTGVEVTPVCSDSLRYDACTVPSSSIPGIKKFTYTATYTFPHTSANWRLIYDGYDVAGSDPGRVAAITNISGPGGGAGGTVLALIDTLNNSVTNTRGHNSSPELTVEPVPFFCANTESCYNPGAVDIYDASALDGEPAGDSLNFALIAANNGTESAGCGNPGTCTYYALPYCGSGSILLSGAYPLQVADCTPASFSFDANNGQLCFDPILQRSAVVYNIEEYRNDTINDITTVAGIGSPGYAGDNGPALSAYMNNPTGIRKDKKGNMYLSDYVNNRIRKISNTGLISTIAGNGIVGYCGDNSPATGASINNPLGIAVDTSGNVIFADYGNNVIRKVNVTTGYISTIAGNGIAGYAGDGSIAAGSMNNYAGNGTAGTAGDGGPATLAALHNPSGLCKDAAGNMYVSDYTNNRIQMITPGGIISTIAGSGAAGYTGDGGSAAIAELNNPEGLWVNTTANVLYFADYSNNVVRSVNLTSGIINTVAGSGTAGYGGDGGAATAAACELNHPHSVFADAGGNLYITDAGNERIRKVDPFGTITTIAGNGTAGYAGFGVLAALPTVKVNNPYGIYEDGSGNLYFADAGNNVIREISSAGMISTYAGSGTPGFSGDGGTPLGANFNTPTDVLMDGNLNMYIVDRGNSCVRKITACNNIISTIAGKGGVAGDGASGLVPDSTEMTNPSFVYTDVNYNVYVSDFGDNLVREITTTELNHPTGVYVDQRNNTYISDAGNSRIRMISGATGIITTIAGNGTAGYGGDGGLAVATACEVNNPYGLYADAAGDVFIADAGNNRIREISAATGNISTVVGNGTAGYAGDECSDTSVSVELNHPTDVSLDPAGDIYIADKLNNRIRKVDLLGDVSTVAGNGTAGFSGDGGAGYLAELNNPEFICLDTSRNVFISDMANNRIRELNYNTTVNRVLVGSMQREMTFTVLSCSTTSPTGKIDSVVGGTRLTPTDSTEIYACQNSGNIYIGVDPREADTSLDITITASGLEAGFSLNVVNDNTSYPTGTVTVNTNATLPGPYTFYLTYTDNNCPLVGTITLPFTVDIYPVPTLTVSVVSPATCADSAAYLVTPGGYGAPWTIKGSIYAFPYDTIKTFANDTGSFIDSLQPFPNASGTYIITIYTSVSNVCAVGDTITPVVPNSNIDVSTTDPLYCGAGAPSSASGGGGIYIIGLPPGLDDSLTYSYQGTRTGKIPFVSSSSGTDTLNNLLAGVYDTIVVQQNSCYDTFKVSGVPSPAILTNPPFTFRTVTDKNPTKCGYCDGRDTIFGIPPNQFDTLEYKYTSLAGVTTYVSTSSLIDADSFFVFSGLCNGTYDSFFVHTAGTCIYVWPGGPITLVAPADTDNFNFTIHYGCNGDTIMFNNLSTAAAGDVLYYHWNFGDGTSDATTDPMHVYNNTVADTVNITLTATNTKCVDSLTEQAVLNNYIHADFSLSPSQFICQLSTDTFTNLSIGVNPSYKWYFGDGDSDVTTNPTHIYTNSGTYTIMLVAQDNMPGTPYFSPCYDTFTQTLAVDSTSIVSIEATDSVLCSGQAVTFTGIYSQIGDTGNVWTFGDGSSATNVNPVQHGYDGEQTFTVTVTALYRVCAAESSSRTIRVYNYPSIYLGPDTTMCPGSAPIALVDNTNATNPKASWLWSTGDTTSAIVVTTPGEYSASVTIDGCSSYDTVVVSKNCYMDVPNAFTPNGDGTNDYFYPLQELTKGVTGFKMDVYNRWGQLLFETTSTDGRGWDGTFNGEPQPEGVYVYVIQATFKDGQIETHQGNVTLIR